MSGDELPAQYRLTIATEKKCKRCRKVKEAAEFYKGVTHSGLSSWCRECQKSQSKEVYWPNRAKRLWTNRQS